MSDCPSEGFGVEDIRFLATTLNDVAHEAFVVGGQALHLWAFRYASRCAALADGGPYTSKDIDFFGLRESAEKLAQALNGEVRYPDGHATPNTAIIIATINGKRTTIDILHSILGVKTDRMQKNVVTLGLPFDTPAGTEYVPISVMHPFHCLQSRIANVVHPAMQRRDEAAMRQLRAAPHILRSYLFECLEAGEMSDAAACVQEMFEYLRSDPYGRNAHLDPGIDLLPIVRAIGGHPACHEHYRTRSIPAMIEEIERRRASRDRRCGTPE